MIDINGNHQRGLEMTLKTALEYYVKEATEKHEPVLSPFVMVNCQGDIFTATMPENALDSPDDMSSFCFGLGQAFALRRKNNGDKINTIAFCFSGIQIQVEGQAGNFDFDSLALIAETRFGLSLSKNYKIEADHEGLGLTELDTIESVFHFGHVFFNGYFSDGHGVMDMSAYRAEMQEDFLIGTVMADPFGGLNFSLS